MKDKMCGPRNLLLLLSCFSRVQLCATPQTAAHQAPQSLGFSRQEYWSGLPFPSPMHESEKWKWSPSVVSRVQLFATPWTVAYQAPLSMGVARQEYWRGVPLPSPPRNLVKANFFFFFCLNEASDYDEKDEDIPDQVMPLNILTVKQLLEIIHKG